VRKESVTEEESTCLHMTAELRCCKTQNSQKSNTATSVNDFLITSQAFLLQTAKFTTCVDLMIICSKQAATKQTRYGTV